MNMVGNNPDAREASSPEQACILSSLYALEKNMAKDTWLVILMIPVTYDQNV